MEQVSILASEVMYRTFPNALLVNNELINKNTISGSIASAKKMPLGQSLMARILLNTLGCNFCPLTILPFVLFWQRMALLQLQTTAVLMKWKMAEGHRMPLNNI